MIALPARVDAITPAWLEAALRPAFPGLRVENAQIIQLIDGTAQKARFAMHYGAGPQGPPSLWVKGGFDAIGVSQGDAFANETRFFAGVAPQLDINLPDCWFAAIDESSNNGVIILEDLLLRGCTFGRATEPLSADAAADVLAMQARYHARYWGVGAVPGQPWLRPGGAIADTGMVGQYFAMWDRSSPLPRFETLSAAQRDRLRMQAALDALMVDLRTRPIALLHGDSQGANLFFEADGRPGYLDWQHCMLGHWGFDLAGFLITAVTVEDRRAHERDLLAGYLEALRRAGVDAPAFDAAFADYSRYAMWTFMWLMCPVEAHPEDVCYANSERAAAAIDDLGTLQLLGI